MEQRTPIYRKLLAVGALAAAFVVLCLAISGAGGEQTINYASFRRDNIIKTIKANDYSMLDADSINAASDLTGNIPEKIIGDPQSASVVIYEYADYACPHCGEWNRAIGKLMKQHNGEIAVVYRAYSLPGFKNSTAAASAATAAQIQGCFEKYKDLLFANQSEWTYASGNDLQDFLVRCFEEASDGNGDIEKFKDDMRSEDVGKRLAYEHEMGSKIGLTGTPTFRIDGETIELAVLKETIEKKLSET